MGGFGGNGHGGEYIAVHAYWLKFLAKVYDLVFGASGVDFPRGYSRNLNAYLGENDDLFLWLSCWGRFGNTTSLVLSVDLFEESWVWGFWGSWRGLFQPCGPGGLGLGARGPERMISFHR